MSRGAAARQRRVHAAARLAVCGRVAIAEADDELRELGDEFREENRSLRDRVTEVEGWYRLLQAEHSALQDNHSRTSRRTSELQTEVNRLERENHELRVWLSLYDEAGEEPRPQPPQHEDSQMIRPRTVIQGIRTHRWAAAAVMAIGTLLLRDASVHGLLARAAERARQAVGAGHDSASSGFVRYAAMINSRDQLERARTAYNHGEASLKGDALLDAQDALRTAKARYRLARLAFLPELARQCSQANVALPPEAAEALAALERDATD